MQISKIIMFYAKRVIILLIFLSLSKTTQAIDQKLPECESSVNQIYTTEPCYGEQTWPKNHERHGDKYIGVWN